MKSSKRCCINCTKISQVNHLIIIKKREKNTCFIVAVDWTRFWIICSLAFPLFDRLLAHSIWRIDNLRCNVNYAVVRLQPFVHNTLFNELVVVDFFLFCACLYCCCCFWYKNFFIFTNDAACATDLRCLCFWSEEVEEEEMHQPN